MLEEKLNDYLKFAEKVMEEDKDSNGASLLDALLIKGLVEEIMSKTLKVLSMGERLVKDVSPFQKGDTIEWKRNQTICRGTVSDMDITAGNAKISWTVILTHTGDKDVSEYGRALSVHANMNPRKINA